ncbi:MAG: SRPBCC family protein [Nitrospiraceae bacterium]|nr:MAG: SRPBCC family protein [Nitrospiraceae bacterium]
MAHMSKKITINAPVEKVFSFITTPVNWTRYVTHLMEVKDISSPGLEKGTTFRWTYRKFGINLHGKGEITEKIKDHKFGLKMKGVVPVEESYTLAPDKKKGTVLYAEIDYGIPQKVIDIISKTGLIEKIYKTDADNILNRIKILCEEG